MKRKSNHNNIHHIIPSSRAMEGFNVKHEENQIEIEQTRHVNLHRLFFNLHPQEQMQMLYNINKKVMSQEARLKVKEVLAMTQEEFYRSDLLDR